MLSSVVFFLAATLCETFFHNFLCARQVFTYFSSGVKLMYTRWLRINMILSAAGARIWQHYRLFVIGGNRIYDVSKKMMVLSAVYVRDYGGSGMDAFLYAEEKKQSFVW